MNYYKLDNKSADENFLKGDVIQCKAVISAMEYSSDLIKEGDKIVVMLSTGQKYLGYIFNFTFLSRDDKTHEGVLDIIKNKPSLPFRT